MSFYDHASLVKKKLIKGPNFGKYVGSKQKAIVDRVSGLIEDDYRREHDPKQKKLAVIDRSFKEIE